MPSLTPYQKEALNYKKHISLTANAGSGKTFVLAKRFVEIALCEDIKLSKIVAITFTDKAAGELNKKIANEIETRFEQEGNESYKKILGRLRRQLISANISTIHSFCINLLKEYSAEAGIDANFTPLSQQDAEELIDLTLEDSLNKALRGDEHREEVRSLIRLLGSKNLLTNELKKLIGKRKSLESVNVSLYGKSIDEIADFYQRTSHNLIEKLFTDPVKRIVPLVFSVNNEVLEIDNQNQNAVEISFLLTKIDHKDIFESLKVFSMLREKLLTKSGTVNKRGYLSKLERVPEGDVELIENFFKEIKAFENIETDDSANKTLARYSQIFMNIFNYVIENYEERKRKNGLLDFEDILLFAQKLTGNEYVKRALREKYEYIMIDEYQDTNEIQYNIVMPILDNLKEGNLFVVGDEKQSIYMFRDAELELFNKTKKEISLTGKGGLLLLPHSFRVAPQIAQFANEVFKKLFSAPNPLLNEVEYNELLCSRPQDDKGEVEFLLSRDESEPEAELTAKRILRLVKEKDLEYQDVAILCRKRSAFTELERAFTEYKIPYLIGGGTGFYQRQIIYDVYNYISFLINNDDDIALIGILRSPFFIVPDNVIFEISQAAGHSFYQKFITFSKDKPELKKILEVLEKHTGFASSASIPKLLRAILADNFYWSVIANKPNARQELSNIYKLIGLGRNFSEQSFKTLYDFKVFIKDAINSMEDEGQAQITDSANAVKIMTYHQSKGLEYKAVFLYRCNERIREERAKSKSIAVDKNWGLLTKVPLNDDYFSDYVSPLIVDVYNYIQNKKLSAEAKRLLYVGITRAIDYLFITGDIAGGKPSANTFLQFIGEALKTDFSSEKITLDSVLRFMLSEEHDFNVIEKKMLTEIPIVSEVERVDNIKVEATSPKFERMLVDKINDTEKNEIVSATKIAIFSQCPVKYYLTYELGYTYLYKVLKSFETNFEFRYEEDEDTKVYSDLKGRVIHKILENEIAEKDIDSAVAKYLSEEDETRLMDSKHFIDLENTIIKDISAFFKSGIFNEIMGYKNYFNEYELYAKEEDYYLYGIIDKLVINQNEAIIIDYKTNSVNKNSIKEKANHYLPQLKFYSYLISLRYPVLSSIKTRLVFIKEPEEKFEFVFGKEELNNFGEYIKEVVEKIRCKRFEKDLSHCRDCHFYLRNSCVKDYN